MILQWPPSRRNRCYLEPFKNNDSTVKPRASKITPSHSWLSGHASKRHISMLLGAVVWLYHTMHNGLILKHSTISALHNYWEGEAFFILYTSKLWIWNQTLTKKLKCRLSALIWSTLNRCHDFHRRWFLSLFGRCSAVGVDLRRSHQSTHNTPLWQSETKFLGIFANVLKRKNRNTLFISIQTLCYETQNWAQVHPASIDHPWDVSTTWLESTCGKINWLAHTFLYKVPQLTVHVSKNQALRSKELSVELWDWEGYKKNVCSIEDPQEHTFSNGRVWKHQDSS